jgi:spermidine/putrescine transport system substrate-binding protein
MIITNGLYLDRLKRGGWLVPLDHGKLPNFFKYAASKYKNPSFDPRNTYTVPWQSGFTGIGYNPKLTGREITSFEDLFDPKFKGKIGMFADNQDMPNLALAGMGINPETSTEADWRKAASKLHAQKPLVRKYYEQDYIQPLSRGDIWISMAWSGDIFQANQSGAPNLKFVLPKEGGVIWTDNLVIPKGAGHPLDAITYANYVFDPTAAAMMAEGINYITPVPAAKLKIESDAGKATGSDKKTLDYLASSPLIFPTQAEYQLAHRYRALTPAEEKVWNGLFEPIYQS